MTQPLNEIEAMFFETAQKLIADIEPQYLIGQYRVDFAVPDDKLAIEIDSKQFHSDHQRQYHDKPRQRIIEALGWTVVRFEASEVLADVWKCVRLARRWLGLKRAGLDIEKIFPT